MAYLPKGIGDFFGLREFVLGYDLAGMAYLPKGIGDEIVLLKFNGFVFWPEWPTCRKALVTKNPRSLIGRKTLWAGMAYLPKGIGDVSEGEIKSTMQADGRNGLLAERHW